MKEETEVRMERVNERLLELSGRRALIEDQMVIVEEEAVKLDGENRLAKKAELDKLSEESGLVHRAMARARAELEDLLLTLTTFARQKNFQLRKPFPPR